MATRSTIINKAFNRKVQGSTDTFWSVEQKNDYFHDAVDVIATAICDADLPFYLVYQETITKDANGLYPLPVANGDNVCRSVRRVMNGDSIDEEIFPYDDDIKESGFVIENGFLRLREWSGDLPATLLIDYRKHPKYIGDWAETAPGSGIGVTDPVSTPAEIIAYSPEPPLNDSRGARIIAAVIGILADVDDENTTEDQAAQARELANQFVDRIGSMYDNDQYQR